MKIKNPQFKERVIGLVKREPLLNHLGITLAEISHGRCVFEFNIQHHHQQGLGYIQGGVTATIADTAAGWAAFTVLGENEYGLTCDLDVKYLRPGVGERCIGIGTVIKAGKQFVFAEAEIYCLSGTEKKLVAKASGTFAVMEI